MRPSVLVLEDETLVALSLEDGLVEAGFEVGGPFASVGEALKWLATRTPDFAILDRSLCDGDWELATELYKRKVPFIVASGLPRGSNEPIELHSARWVSKPYDVAQVIRLFRDPGSSATFE